MENEFENYYDIEILQLPTKTSVAVGKFGKYGEDWPGRVFIVGEVVYIAIEPQHVDALINFMKMLEQ